MFYGHEWHIYNTVRIQDGMMVQTLTWQHLKICVSAVVAPRPRCVPLQDNIWISTASAAAVGFDPLRRLGVVTSVGLGDVHRISWGNGHLIRFWNWITWSDSIIMIIMVMGILSVFGLIQWYPMELLSQAMIPHIISWSYYHNLQLLSLWVWLYRFVSLSARIHW